MGNSEATKPTGRLVINLSRNSSQKPDWWLLSGWSKFDNLQSYYSWAAFRLR
jgi:hypothetical protein